MLTIKLAGGIALFTPLLTTVGQITAGEQSDADLRINSAADTTEKDKAKKGLQDMKDKRMEQAIVAMLLMQQADRIRYGRRYGELDRSMDLGRDEFPVNITGAFDILTLEEHRVLEQSNRQQSGNVRPSYIFAQQGNDTYGSEGGGERRPREMPQGTVMVPGRNSETIPWQCYNCNEWGHLSRQCTKPRHERNGNQGVSMCQCVNSITFSNVID